MAQVRSNDISGESVSRYSYPSLSTRGTKRACIRVSKQIEERVDWFTLRNAFKWSASCGCSHQIEIKLPRFSEIPAQTRSKILSHQIRSDGIWTVKRGNIFWGKRPRHIHSVSPFSASTRVKALLNLARPALDSAIASCTSPIRSSSENALAPAGLAASTAIFPTCSGVYNTRSKAIYIRTLLCVRIENGLTDANCPSIKLVRLACVEFERLFPSFQDRGPVDGGISIMVHGQDAQRNVPTWHNLESRITPHKQDIMTLPYGLIVLQLGAPCF